MIQIAHIETPFKTKFGVPRQAGLVNFEARIVFEPEFRVPEAVRGLEEFDYLWLIWRFHLTEREEWSPTVRPPRLGGNKRVGVFATRSPFRPNPILLAWIVAALIYQLSLML
jgi:tRNA-Thr(GGU) m(6)t(6)A37 methyltransferase TsaA